MRNLSIFIFLLLISHSAYCQLFDDAGNQWNVRIGDAWSSYSTKIFKYEGDTLIDTMIFRKMYSANDSSSNAYWEYRGAVREWEGKVYGCTRGRYNEGLLYDFTLNTGDTAYVINEYCEEPFEVVCTATDSTAINGNYRKTFSFTFPYGQWIEGIGSLAGPLFFGYDLCITDVFSDLLCFYNAENLLYLNPDAGSCYETNVGVAQVSERDIFSIYPNPAATRISLRTGQLTGTDTRIELINAQGSVAGSFLSNPAYIDVSDLPDGIYLIRLATEKSIQTRKLIIRH